MRQFVVLLSWVLVIGAALFGLYVYAEGLQGNEVKYGVWIVLGAAILGLSILEQINGKIK